MRFERLTNLFSVFLVPVVGVSLSMVRPAFAETRTRGAQRSQPAAAEAQQAEEPESTAEREKRIRQLMRDGVVDYRRSNYTGARDAFQKAWQLSRHLDIAASLADVEMKLGHYLEAAGYWEYYLGNMPPDRADAEAQLAECRKHLGSINVVVDTPDAAILVDDQVAARAPVSSPIWLKPGEHTIVARLGEQKSAPQSVSLTEGSSQNVTLKLKVASAPEQVAPPVEPLSPEPLPGSGSSKGSKTAPIVVLVAGGALTVTAVALGIVYKGKGDDENTRRLLLLSQFDTKFPGAACSAPSGSVATACDTLDKSAERVDTFRNTSLVSFVAAGALGVATALTTYLLWPSGSSEKANVRVIPWTAGRSHGATFELSF